jgi:hypothetical protein
MPVRGADVGANNIIKFGGNFKNHVNKVMAGVQDRLDAQVTMNISLSDHSLRDLAAAGHPYAKRHGSQGLAIHEPNWMVHIQSGQLLSSKKSGTTPCDIVGGQLKATAWCGVDENIAPHALYVYWGTSRMIPRDFLNGSLDQIRPEVYAVIHDNLRNLVQSFEAH